MKLIHVLMVLISILLVSCVAEPAQDTALAGNIVEVIETSQPVSRASVFDEMLSDLSCGKVNADRNSEGDLKVESFITVMLTNLYDDDLDLSDVRFRVDSRFDASPDCDTTLLAPGESTVCSGLHVPDDIDEETHTVQVLARGEEMIQKVNCDQ